MVDSSITMGRALFSFFSFFTFFFSFLFKSSFFFNFLLIKFNCSVASSELTYVKLSPFSISVKTSLLKIFGIFFIDLDFSLFSSSSA